MMIPVRVSSSWLRSCKIMNGKKTMAPTRPSKHNTEQNLFVMFFEEIHALNFPVTI